MEGRGTRERIITFITKSRHDIKAANNTCSSYKMDEYNEVSYRSMSDSKKQLLL